MDDVIIGGILLVGDIEVDLEPREDIVDPEHETYYEEVLTYHSSEGGRGSFTQHPTHDQSQITCVGA